MMSYSTQKDSFSNFYNCNYKSKCTFLSKVIKLHHYCIITDYRSFSLYKGLKSNYIQNLVASRNLCPTSTFLIENKIFQDKNIGHYRGQLNSNPKETEHLIKDIKTSDNKFKSSSLIKSIQNLYDQKNINKYAQDELLSLANNLCQEVKCLKKELALEKGKLHKHNSNNEIEKIVEANTKNNERKNQQITQKTISSEQIESCSSNNTDEFGQKPDKRLSTSSSQNNFTNSEKLKYLQDKIRILQKRAGEAEYFESELKCAHEQIGCMKKIAENEILKLTLENQKMQTVLEQADRNMKGNYYLYSKLKHLEEENWFLKNQMSQIDDLKEALIHQFNCLVKANMYNRKLKALIGENDPSQIIQNLERDLVMCQYQNERKEGFIKEYKEQYKKFAQYICNFVGKMSS